MKKIICLMALLANAFATPIFAQTAEEIFKKVFDNGEAYEIEEIGKVTAYAFYDVDDDDVSECFLKGDDGAYCMFYCGDDEGKPSEAALKMSLNTFPGTTLTIVKDRRWINVQGGCGSGCYITTFAKISKSHIEFCIADETLISPEGEESHECNLFGVAGMDVKEIKKAEFDRTAPKNYKAITMEELKWIEKKVK